MSEQELRIVWQLFVMIQQQATEDFIQEPSLLCRIHLADGCCFMHVGIICLKFIPHLSLIPFLSQKGPKIDFLRRFKLQWDTISKQNEATLVVPQ